MRTVCRLGFIVAALVAFSATAASAFPPSEKPHFFVGEDGTCSLFIDPPLQFPVTFSGTIDGVAFSRVGFYGATEPHKAKVDVTDLMGVGFKHVVVTAKGPFLGTSPTTTGDFTCKPEPSTTSTSSTSTSTTTSVSSTTSVSPSTATTSTSTTSIAKSSHSITPSTRIGTAVTSSRARELPMTGSDTAPLALFGASLVASGWLLTRGRNR